MDLFEYQGREYFARFELPVPAGNVADNVEDAVRVAEAAGYPVVIKLLSDTITHKSDVGGVVVGVRDAPLYALHRRRSVQAHRVPS